MKIEKLRIEYTEEIKKQLLRIRNTKETIIFLIQQDFPITEGEAEDYFRHLSKEGVPLKIRVDLTDEEREELFRINSAEEADDFMKVRGFLFTQRAADDLCQCLELFRSWKDDLAGYSLNLYANVTFAGSQMLVEAITAIEKGEKKLQEIYRIPADTFRHYSGQFAGKKELKHVFIPEGVTKIPDGTFYGCTDLESVMLPSTVVSIGHLAFNDCVRLRNINFSQNLAEIGYGAFRNCGLLQTEMLPEKLEEKRKREAQYMSKLKEWWKKDPEAERHQMGIRPINAFSVLKDLTSVLDFFWNIELTGPNNNYEFDVNEIQAPDMKSIVVIPEEEIETEIDRFVENSFYCGIGSGPSNDQLFAFSAKGIKAYVKNIMLDALKSIGALLYSGDVITKEDYSLSNFMEIRSGKQWYMIKEWHFD